MTEAEPAPAPVAAAAAVRPPRGWGAPRDVTAATGTAAATKTSTTTSTTSTTTTSATAAPSPSASASGSAAASAAAPVVSLAALMAEEARAAQAAAAAREAAAADAAFEAELAAVLAVSALESDVAADAVAATAAEQQQQQQQQQQQEAAAAAAAAEPLEGAAGKVEAEDGPAPAPDDDDDDDASLAAKLQAEEEAAAAEAARARREAQAAEDAAFALRLQAQLDTAEHVRAFEQVDRARRERAGQLRDAPEKVSVVPQAVLDARTGDGAAATAAALAAAQYAEAGDEDGFLYYYEADAASWSTDEDSEESLEDYDDPDVWFANDAPVVGASARSGPLAGGVASGVAPRDAKQYHQSSKQGGRLPRGTIVQEMMPIELTKHDARHASARNAHHLESVLAASAGDLKGIGISDKVYHGVTQRHFRQQGHRNRVRGNRLDAATSQSVLDQRTRASLLKLLNADVLDEIHGVISTGKEANVYHALAGADAEEAVAGLTTGLAPAFSGGGAAAVAAPGASVAIKIYKTSMNEFKNRADYIEGERRFRGQSGRASLRGNPRKLIKLWAEKEARNLKRMCAADIPVPVPLLLRDSVLIMQFLGRRTQPFPRLHDIDWKHDAALADSDALGACYVHLAKIMRRMYHDARLVHGDLSDFNVLIDPRSLTKFTTAGSSSRRGERRAARRAAAAALAESAAAGAAAEAAAAAAAAGGSKEEEEASDASAAAAAAAPASASSSSPSSSSPSRRGNDPTPVMYVIDVSQSVEHDHPRALEFLRSDCAAVTQAFRRAGLEDALTVRQLFDFVVDARLQPKDFDRYLDALRDENYARGQLGEDEQAEMDVQDGVFMNRATHIPRTLQQIPLEDAVSELFGDDEDDDDDDDAQQEAGGEGGKEEAADSAATTAAAGGPTTPDRRSRGRAGSDASAGSALSASSPFHKAATLGHDLLE